MARWFVCVAAMALMMAKDALGVATPGLPYKLNQFLPRPGDGANCVSGTAATCLATCQKSCVSDASCIGVSYNRKNKGCQKLTKSCSRTADIQYYLRVSEDAISCGPREYDLIFVVDESGSVQESNYQLMREFMNSVVASLSLSTEERVLKRTAVVTFSTIVNSNSGMLDAQTCPYETTFLGIAYAQGATNIEDGIVKATNLVKQRPANRKSIVVLMTDGLPNRRGPQGAVKTDNIPAATRAAAQALVNLGNTHMVYARIQNADPALFNGVSQVTAVNVGDFSANNFNTFFSTVSGIIGKEVCITERPTSSPTKRPTSNRPTLRPTGSPTVSPTKFPTTLPPSTCTVLSQSAKIVSFPDTQRADVSSSFSVSHGAAVTVNEIQLSTGEQDNTRLSLFAFSKIPQNLVGGFISEFVVNMDKLNAANGQASSNQGFAFVIHRSPDVKNIPSATGKGLGYKFIPNSVAIIFDLCSNREDGDKCLEQELRVEYNPAPGKSAPPLDSQIIVNPDIERKNWVRVNVEYLEQASRLRVYASFADSLNTLPPITKTDERFLLLEHNNFRVDSILGGIDAFLGFTSATSEIPARSAVTSWQVFTIPVIFENTQLVNDLGDGPVQVEANGIAKNGLTIQLRDKCLKDVTYGGQGDLMSAVFLSKKPVSEGRRLRSLQDGGEESKELTDIVIRGETVDLASGQYTGALSTRVENRTFDAYITVGDGCSLDVDEKNMKVTLKGNPNVCFFRSFENAIVTIPPADKDIGVIVTPPPPPNDTNVGAIAAGGGVAAFLFVVAAFAMVKYRNKWREDKAFIDEGNLYNLEKDVQYSTPDATAMVARQVQQTKEEILREKKASEKMSKASDIVKLEEEQRELQDQLRNAKQNHQQESSTLASKNPKHLQNKKKEFQAKQATL